MRGYIYVPDHDQSDTGTVLIKASDPSSDGNCVAVSKNISESAIISIKVCKYQGARVDFCDHAEIRPWHY